jgi:hypothetical protein
MLKSVPVLPVEKSCTELESPFNDEIPPHARVVQVGKPPLILRTWPTDPVASQIVFPIRTRPVPNVRTLSFELNVVQSVPVRAPVVVALAFQIENIPVVLLYERGPSAEREVSPIFVATTPERVARFVLVSARLPERVFTLPERVAILPVAVARLEFVVLRFVMIVLTDPERVFTRPERVAMFHVAVAMFVVRVIMFPVAVAILELIVTSWPVIVAIFVFVVARLVWRVDTVPESVLTRHESVFICPESVPILAFIPVIVPERAD